MEEAPAAAPAAIAALEAPTAAAAADAAAVIEVVAEEEEEEEEGGGEGEGGGGGGGERKRRRSMPPEARWNAFIDEFSHVKPDGTLLCTIDTTPAMKARWLHEKTIRCLICKITVNGKQQLQNIGRHFKNSVEHKKKLELILKPCKPIVPITTFFAPPATTSSMEELKVDRIVLTLSAARWIVPSNVHQMFSGDTGTLALRLLKSDMAPGSATTTRRDIHEGIALMDGCIRDIVKGRFVALCFDEASTALGGKGRPLGVMLEGAGIEPIFVDMYWS